MGFLWKKTTEFGDAGTDKDGVALPAATSTVRYILTGEDGVLFAYFTGTNPSAVAGYAPGCILISINNAKVYYNSGSKTSCTFTQMNA